MEKTKTTKAQQRAVQKYVKDKYDRAVLTMPKGEKDKIRKHAETMGESMNAFINRAINETMINDTEPLVVKVDNISQDEIEKLIKSAKEIRLE